MPQKRLPPPIVPSTQQGATTSTSAPGISGPSSPEVTGPGSHSQQVIHLKSPDAWAHLWALACEPQPSAPEFRPREGRYLLIPGPTGPVTQSLDYFGAQEYPALPSVWPRQFAAAEPDYRSWTQVRGPGETVLRDPDWVFLVLVASSVARDGLCPLILCPPPHYAPSPHELWQVAPPGGDLERIIQISPVGGFRLSRAQAIACAWGARVSGDLVSGFPRGWIPTPI